MTKDKYSSIIKSLPVLLRYQILQENREFLVPRHFIISSYPNLLPLMHFWYLCSSALRCFPCSPRGGSTNSFCKFKNLFVHWKLSFWFLIYISRVSLLCICTFRCFIPQVWSCESLSWIFFLFKILKLICCCYCSVRKYQNIF